MSYFSRYWKAKEERSSASQEVEGKKKTTDRVELVRSEDLGDLDELIEVVVTLELWVEAESAGRVGARKKTTDRQMQRGSTHDDVLPEDHARDGASQTPHVQSVVVLPVVNEELRSEVAKPGRGVGTASARCQEGGGWTRAHPL